MVVLVADRSRLFVGSLTARFRRNNPARHRSHFWVAKRAQQKPQPVRVGNGIVVDISQYVGLALCYSTIACVAKTTSWLDHVDSREITRYCFRLLISRS